MQTINEILPQIDTLTFDCYGTLIDWKGGLRQSFRKIFGSMVDTRMDQLFDTYVQVEAEIESGSYCSYREVLSVVTQRIAENLGKEIPTDQQHTLAEMLPDWPAFEDTNEALKRLKNKFRLGVLSNIDRDLFTGTATTFDVDFDFVVTAEDVQSYKPSHGHFSTLFDKHGPKDRILHVAQSLYHDGRPAGELGLAYAWINRYNQINDTDVKPLIECADLKSLADAIC